MHDFKLEDRFDSIGEWSHRKNGLTVLTVPTPVAPVVGLAVVYRVGSRHEATGHTGATHMLEHLMFKGSEKFNAERGTEIARTLHRVGASFNATTWLDRTTYFEVLPVDELRVAVDIESDRMRGALIRDEDLASERTVVLNELDTGENEPVDLLMKASFAHAFLEHPYHHPTIGWRGDVENMSAEVLRRFYDTYYHPDNATIIVVGDIDEEAALAEVERGFGAIPGAKGGFPQPKTRERRQRGVRRFNIERVGELGSLAMTWHIPEGLHSDLPALNVLTQALSDGVTSRLYQSLVETNRCLGVHSFTFELHDPGVLQVFATLAPGEDHASIEALIRDEIEGLCSTPPQQDELARAIIQTRTELAFNRESPAQIMGGLTEAVAMGDWRRFPRELETVSAVSADDVQRVVLEYLNEKNLTVGWFVPEGGGGSVSTRRPAPTPCYLEQPLADRVELRDLPGGARLAVLTNPHAPTVTIAGTIGAGVAAAPDGRFTIPSLTAAMLDRGTSDHDRFSLARELEDHGLHLAVRAMGNAPATVSYSAQGLSEQFDRLATLLTEILRFPTFPADELDRLRKRILGALRRESEDTSAQAFAALTRSIYPAGHPMHKRSIEARESELDEVVRDELITFHRRVYGPKSMVLAVVGNVEADAVETALTARFREWAGGAEIPPEPAQESQVGPEVVRIHLPDRPNLDFYLGHRGRLRRGDPDAAAAGLANACLGQSALTSRLGVKVRDEEGLSYSIYSRFFGTLHIPGPWAVSCSVSADNLERALDLSREIVADYVEHGPEKVELDDERQAQAGAYQVGLATNAGIAHELVATLTAGEPISRIDEHPSQVLATTREEVVEATRKHIRPDELSLAVAGTLDEAN